MLKKDFLEYLHKDWLVIATQLKSELNERGRDYAAHVERLRKAHEWIDHYAEQLRELYGVQA